MCETNAGCSSAASALPLCVAQSAHLNGPPGLLLFHHLEGGEEGEKGVNSNAVGSPGLIALLGEWVTSKRDTNIEVGKPHHCSVDEPAEGSCQCCRQGRANTAGAWSIGWGQCTVLACWGLLTVTGNYSTFFQS